MYFTLSCTIVIGVVKDLFVKKKHQLCSRVDEVCLSICLCGIHYSSGNSHHSPWVRYEGLLVTVPMKGKHQGFHQCFALINTLVSGLKVIIGSLRPTQKHCCIYSSFVTSQAKGLFRLSGLKEGDS